jgi:bacterioferritin
MPQFVKDMEALRRRAERKIEEGAVTESYRGDVEHTIAILNEALATEIVCVLRYMHHYFMATGVHGSSVSDEFKEHADAEREHADQIAERIQQLGGKPDFNPKTLLERSASQYIEGETLADMIREDLIAERIVIEVYQEMVRHFANNDPTTRHMVEEILADEEEHASDLADLLYIVDPASGKTEGQDPGTQPLKLRRDEQSEERRPMAQERKDSEEGERQQQRGMNRTDLKTAGIRVGGPSGRGPAPTSGESAKTPGVSGRPMNRRKSTDEIEPEIAESEASGSQSGGTRKVAVTNKKNKRRAA